MDQYVERRMALKTLTTVHSSLAVGMESENAVDVFIDMESNLQTFKSGSHHLKDFYGCIFMNSRIK